MLPLETPTGIGGGGVSGGQNFNKYSPLISQEGIMGGLRGPIFKSLGKMANRLD